MIKKSLLTFALVVVLAAMALGFSPAKHVYAQGGLTWTSSFQVYNPGSATANVTYYYYNQSDGSVAGTVPDTIPANGSKTYFPITGVPSGFNGSLVISSDLPLATITNLVTTDFHFTGSSMGFSAGSTSFGIPLIACNNVGFNTFFSIQNAGSADANITVTYIPGGHGVSGKTDAVVLHAGQSKTLDQSTSSTTGTKTCNDLKDGSGKFIGAASITSDQPVVATGYYMNTTTNQALSAFNGFSGGSTTVVAPLIMANNSNYWSSIQVQNVGSSATDVTITYGANTISGGYSPTGDSCLALAAGQSCTVLQSGGQWLPTSKRYIGSATITSSGQPIVVMVNTVNLAGGATNTKMDSYDGFNPATVTNTLDMPLLMANNSGWYTSFNMMNVGTGSCNVTATYSANTAGTFAPIPENFTLAAGASHSVLMSGSTPNNGSDQTWAGAGKYIGSGTAVGTGTGCQIAAVVNQLGTGGYDTLLSYDAFNR